MNEVYLYNDCLEDAINLVKLLLHSSDNNEKKNVSFNINGTGQMLPSLKGQSQKSIYLNCIGEILFYQ